MNNLPFGLSLFQMVLFFTVLVVIYFSSIIFILSSHKTTMKEKIGWLSVILFIPILGLVIYWIKELVVGFSSK
ncbi:MAG: hypothetical protein ACJAUV_000801 [Flavobacteriales bacterium]|jgi:hypothetical protein